MIKSRRSRHKKKANNIQDTSELPDDCRQNECHNSRDESAKKIYSVEKSETLGRYLVSSRYIEAGEMIIDGELPLVVGPIQQSDPLCLGCYIPLPEKSSRCSKCNWPLCDASCNGLHIKYGHTDVECNILSAIPYDEELLRDKLNVFNCIVPLRCLLMKKHSLREWKDLMNMESHNAIRQKIPSIQQLNENTVAQKLGKYFDYEEIHTVCGILEVNCFEVTRTDISLRALFCEAALMSHNCVSKTMHANDDDFRLRVRASVSIPEGQPITISYAYTLQGTAKRRAHIKETKFFDCNCDRCSDSTELGTNLSTFVCPKCNHPTLISSAPLSRSPVWICNHKKCAKFTVTQMDVDALTEKLETKLNDLPENGIESYEKWIKEASMIFHKNHYLIAGVKYSLSLLYGKTEGFMLPDLDDSLLQRKIEICEELLEIANIIEPGLSRLRGILLYELHAPMMMLLNKRRELKQPSKKQLKHTLQRIVSYLQESCNILQFESKNTMEGKLGRAAQEALLSVRHWEAELGRFAR